MYEVWDQIKTNDKQFGISISVVFYSEWQELHMGLNLFM